MNKYINFTKISIQNFLSVGKIPVEINLRSGLHIITGVNRDQADRRNGIGKSTILDAFSFALFGTTLRELKKEFIINNITKKTSKISLDFNVSENGGVKNYTLHRTIEPNKCFLYEDGVDITRDSMVNTTDFVQNLLGLTPEVFQNCIAMTINSTTPFMAKKKIEKRKFIENIFNLEIFSTMNGFLKTELTEVKRDFDIASTRHEEAKLYLDNLNKQIENRIIERDQRQKTLQHRLSRVISDIENTNLDLEKIQSLNISNVESKIAEAEIKLNDLGVKINTVGKEIISIETKKNFAQSTLTKIGTDKDTCPVCLKPVTDSDKNHIKDKKNSIQIEIDDHEKNIEVLENKLKVYEDSKIKLNEAINKLKNIVNNQKIQNENKKFLIQKLKDLESQKNNFETDIQDLKKCEDNTTNAITEQLKKINEYKLSLDTKRDNINVLDIVKFVLGEDGVRSYIVKKILVLFNGKLSYYLRKLNSNAFITFDEYFEESIKNNKGVPVCYFNFSGAEKKVIDLAIMFTFIEMLRMQGNVVYNIQFYDELLDTSLDEAGVEMVIELLNDLVNQFNTGIYVISHRKECSKLSTGDVIFLEKKEGITKRINYS